MTTVTVPYIDEVTSTLLPNIKVECFAVNDLRKNTVGTFKGQRAACRCRFSLVARSDTNDDADGQEENEDRSSYGYFLRHRFHPTCTCRTIFGASSLVGKRPGALIIIATVTNIAFAGGDGMDGVGFAREAFLGNIIDFDSGAVSLHCEVSGLGVVEV